jgi:hypothetical protein
VKLLREILLILILTVFNSTIIFSSTYIVAETGGDFNKIQDAVNVAVAGDTVLVREKVLPYNELVRFTRSGNGTGGFITLMAYPNEKPVIDATGLNLGSDWIVGIVKIINKSYIRVQGFEIRNLITSDGNKFPAGIWVRGAGEHIEIIGNDVHNIEHHNSDAGAHGIAVYGTSSNSSINDLLIENNEVHDCILAWSESVVLNGNVENFIVNNNIVHDNDNIAYDFIGYEGTCRNESLDQARNGLVTGNIAYNIDSRVNPAYGGDASADGFYVDGGRDIIFERNLSHNCNVGFELASEHGGKVTRNIIMRSNFIYNCDAIGMAIGGYDAQRGKTINCKIINNTFYKNRSDDVDWGAELEIQYYCDSNTVKNNIFYASTNKPFISYSNTTGSNFEINNNLYFTDGTKIWRWEGTSYSDFSEYCSGTGNDANSIYDDPQLNIENEVPKILESSPAVNSGENLPESIVGVLDYVGANRIEYGTIDIGAVEYFNPDGVRETNLETPTEYKLFNAYPNPVSLKANGECDSITIGYSIDSSKGKNETNVNISLYDILGRKVATLVNKVQSPGKYKINYVPTNLSAGTYFYTLRVNNNIILTKKLLLIK